MKCHLDSKNPDDKERRGYLKIKLVNDQKELIQWWVARFIYYAFMGNILKGLEIDHIDGNRTNNAIKNLRMVTRQQNIKAKSITKNTYNWQGWTPESGTTKLEYFNSENVSGKCRGLCNNCGFYWINTDGEMLISNGILAENEIPLCGVK